MTPTFMIVPSLSCQASCKYCFGPHRGAMMDEKTAEQTVKFIQAAANECGLNEVAVIFHGGEPLLAPYEIWETLLKGISAFPMPVRFSVQSNLWNLDERFLDLFERYHVAIGTSLDGPKHLCDENRGAEYFDRTFASIERAKKRGQNVGVIATLTKQTIPHAEEILSFFRDNGINPVLHAAVKGIDSGDDTYALPPAGFAEEIIKLYPWYVRNRKYFSVPTLDNYCKAVVHGETGVCTMQDCLGMFLAVSPTGDITGCQRMSGKKEFTLGNIFDCPTVEQLMNSPAALRLKERQRQVAEKCVECEWLSVCRGGCYYNAVSMGDGVIDPLCEGYKKIYGFLQNKVMEEIDSEDNISALHRRSAKKDENPILRDGKYISLSHVTHPSKTAKNARDILGAYALGRFQELSQAAEYMTDNRFSDGREDTERALFAMKHRLERERTDYNNCYIHTTFRCNLRCTHCYASAGEKTAEMPIVPMEKLARQAIDLKFRQLIITGGEPLFHMDREGLIDLCSRLRGRGSNLVLRTNLTGDFTESELIAIARAFDQVVVSIDGDEITHDARRGAGTYRNAVANCEKYAALAPCVPRAGELSLACVMPAKEINGEAGQSVQALGDRLCVPRVRFRPLLPIGRAASAKEPVFSECINQHEPVEDILCTPFHPMRSCGIGQNIYICPDGESYPCYAWQTESSYLGNVITSGLENIMSSLRFTRLRGCTVDTNEKCKTCEVRYLCGGACRAWGNQQETDPNTAPPICDHLKNRAYQLLKAAEKYITE